MAIFFLFDEISKMRILEPKNVLPILHTKHVFLALEPPKIKIMTKNFIGMLNAHTAYRNDLTPFLG